MAAAVWSRSDCSNTNMSLLQCLQWVIDSNLSVGRFLECRSRLGKSLEQFTPGNTINCSHIKNSQS